VKTEMISRQLRARLRCHWPSVCPTTSSIATNTCSPKAPTSWTVTTLGCETRAIACASRMSRAEVAPVGPEPSAAFISLSATSRPRWGSRAASTTPMPPEPIIRSIW
jgi:hypothetical protein